MSCYCLSNISTNQIIKTDWLPQTTDSEPSWYYCEYTEILQESAIQMFNDFGLSPIRAAVFYCPVNCSPDYAHVDVNHNKIRTVSAFNLVWRSSPGSRMIWYHENENFNETEPTPDGSLRKWPKYLINWKISELNTLDVFELPSDYLTLVRTDVPHAVFTESCPRICISIRFSWHLDAWEQQIDYLKSKNLLSGF